MGFHRHLFVLAAFVGALSAGAALAAPAPAADDMSMGNPKARIRVVEYASVACPHCAHFQETVLDAFKAKWVDTGKARFTLKEMLTASPTVAMAGFLIARCAGRDRYFKVVDDIYRSQPQWLEGQIKPILARVAADNGVDETHFNACLQDQAAIAAVNQRAMRAQEKDGINSTPSLFINGKMIDPLPQTPAEMDAVLAAAKSAAAKKAGGRAARSAPKTSGGR
jgi:protein-disulfide isomerase